jgi:hypothetical protein
MWEWRASASQLASYVRSVTARRKGQCDEFLSYENPCSYRGIRGGRAGCYRRRRTCQSTNSELHVIHVSEPGAEISLNPAYSLNRDLLDEPLRELERQGRHLLNGQVKKIEEAGEPSRKPISGSEADQTTRSLSWPRS